MSATKALLNKHKHHVLNLGRIMRGQSSFKVLVVLSFAAAFEGGMFYLFLGGFKFLENLGGVGLLVLRRLFSLFFLGMGVMLFVSSVVTSYATIFRSEEVSFLVVRPIRMSQIAVYKFLESTGFSSWAFFFVIIPFVGAYAWHEGLSVFFGLWTFLFSIPFLLLCSGLGAIAVMVFVRWFPRGHVRRLVQLSVVVAVCLIVLKATREAYSVSNEASFNLSRLVPGLSLASNALLPSWWISEGILSFSRGEWFRGGMFFGVTVSTALLLLMIIEWLGGMIFYAGWQRVVAESGEARRMPVLLPRMERCFLFVPSDIRAMAMKDIRSFLRDPMQWSQALIFFGLLGLYFANLRTFRYHVYPASWRNTIAFLNVFSVSAVMCSLGSRFIYPQLSLEGQGFWVLGLAPTTATRILMTKFVMAVGGMLMVSVGLTLLSAGMLNASVTTRIVAVVLACSISFAVCGLSVGLGAIFLDLNKRNPAAIVSGFGGTLNLVLGLAFLIAAIFPFGVVFHLHLAHRTDLVYLHRGLFVSFMWLCVLTVVATFVPLWIGRNSLERREF
jgi:ABC-2 type transport system permease protein